VALRWATLNQMRLSWHRIMVRHLATGIVALSVIVQAVFSTSIELIPTKQKGAGALFRIHYGPKWGYMDRTGKTIITPQFDWESDFFDGLCQDQNEIQMGFYGRARSGCDTSPV